MDWLVKNAQSRDVERQHLNKILQEIRNTLNELEARVSRSASEEQRIRDVVIKMVTTGNQSGINVTYNTTSKAIDFAVRTFTIQLTGAVTGMGTVTGLGNVSISTTLSEEFDGVEEAPMDGLSYWRNMGSWVTVPFPLETVQFLTPGGMLVLDEDLNWYAREIEGPASVIVTNGDGIAGNPSLELDGDEADPGSLYSYATNLDGDKGWYRPALFESTGLLAWSSPYLAINGSDPTKFDVGQAVVGYTDYSTNPVGPERHYAVYGPTTGNAVPSLANIATWVGIQTPGNTLVMQTTAFTPTQRRTIVQLGTVISNGTQLIAVNPLPVVMRAGINQISDFMTAVGPINTGNLISPNGANLQINKGAGVIFKEGSNFSTNPDDPHNLALSSLTAANFNYRTSTGVQAATTNSVNVTQYESPLGTLTAIPPSDPWVVQRIYVFTSNLIRIQYGQHAYHTMAAAEAAIATETFATEANIAGNGVLLGFLIVERNATALNNPAQAKFIPANKFGGAVGSGGTSITNTDSLPEGSVNLYYTDARARTAVVTASITNGDTTHSPSGDAVFDALALKADASSLASYLPLAGGTITGNIVYNVTPFQFIAATVDGSDTSRAAFSGGGGVGASRGGYVICFGNESAISPGSVNIITGNGAEMVFSGGNLRSTNDNSLSNGTAAVRWSVIYAATGTINTSDAREKTVVQKLTESELNAAMRLAREVGTYRWLAAVAEKGDAARHHIGLTVQQAISIMEEFDLDPFKYGFICYDEWEERPEEWIDVPEVRDDYGQIVEPARQELLAEYMPAGNRYSFRMDELLLFIARGQEERLRKIEAALNLEDV